MTQESHFWAFIQEKRKHVSTKTSVRMFKVALFKIAVNWKLLKCPSVGNG